MNESRLITVAGATVELLDNTGGNLLKYFYQIDEKTLDSIKFQTRITLNSIDIFYPEGNEISIPIPKIFRGKFAPIDFVRKYIAYYATIDSDDWNLVHGAGHCKEGVGVLLTGRSGAGKTTLSRELLRKGFELLEEDSLLLHDGKMFTIGTCGFFQSYNDETSIEAINNSGALSNCKIKYVFYLNKNMSGGQWIVADSIALRKWSQPDFISQKKLIEKYLSKPGILLDANIYEIGTADNLTDTVDLIHSIIA